MKRQSLKLPERNEVEDSKRRRLPSSFYNVPKDNRSPQATLLFDQLNIHFPYEPYKCQVNYMEILASALQEKSNALLESPTGTGKTICLLSTVLAFQYHCFHGLLPYHRKTSITPVEEIRRDDNKMEGLLQKAVNATSICNNPDNAPIKPPSVIAFESVPRVWYASRTHTQLTQVIDELKQTEYYKIAYESPEEFSMRLVILGSRDQYCVNPELSGKTGQLLENHCRKLTLDKLCRWHNGCNSALSKADIFRNQVMDIQQLKKLAANGIDFIRPFCPFYATRDSVSNASFICLPYSYLVNPIIREQLKIDVTNDVVIVDEGHNLESTAEDEYSFTFNESNLQAVLSAIEVSDKLLTTRSDSNDVKDLQTSVLSTLKKFIQELQKIPLRHYDISPSLKSERCSVMTLDQFREATLLPAGLTKRFTMTLEQLFKRLQIHLEYFDFHNQDSSIDTKHYSSWAWIVGRMTRYFRCFWDDSVEASSSRFRVAVFLTMDERWQGGQHCQDDYPRQIQFWSFAPHVAMEGILSQCHSLIITSGTLKPLNVLATQIGNNLFRFPHQLENDHVITQDQLYTAIVNVGPNNEVLNLSYDYLRKTGNQIVIAVGKILLDVVEIAPTVGHLVFFSSYSQLCSFTDVWKRNGIIAQMESKIHIFQEPKSAAESSNVLKMYMDVFTKGYSHRCSKGAIFFAVCRGRLSEGINLSDNFARSATIIGIPFPSLKDVRIYTKRNILNQSDRPCATTGRSWYSNQAFQAVNQAIGRVIRHKKDYGAILLLDTRYKEQIDSLSAWVKVNLTYNNNCGNAVSWSLCREQLSQFFNSRDPDLRNVVSNDNLGSAVIRQPDVQSVHALQSVENRYVPPKKYFNKRCTKKLTDIFNLRRMGDKEEHLCHKEKSEPIKSAQDRFRLNIQAARSQALSAFVEDLEEEIS